MSHATIDFETRSLADLKRVGAYAYSIHPSTEIMCMSWRVGDGPIATWRPEDVNLPEELVDHVTGGGRIEAHNAFFERCIWENVMGRLWPVPRPDQWECSASKAAALSLPRALGNATAALNLSERKDDDGRKAMMKLSRPYKGELRDGTPEELERLHAYCEQDVRSEAALSDALPELSELERRVWLLDQKINMRGIAVDQGMLRGALTVAAESKVALDAELRELTGGRVERATMRAAILAWVNGEFKKGTPALPDTKGTTVDEWLERDDLPAGARRVLELLRAANRTSTAKYRAVEERLGPDGRIRDLFMYHAASTGRWGGRGFQPHNLPRGEVKDWDGAADDIRQGDRDWLRTMHGDEMKLLSHALRGVIVAPEGKEFIVADFSAIEARMLLWLADDAHGLDVFRAGEDIYVDMAQDIYGVRLAKNVTKDQRFIGKQAILGLGYGMGPPKFKVNCAKYDVDITEEFSKKTVKTYREKYRKVKDFWWSLNEAAMDATRTPGRRLDVGRVAYGVTGGFLKCRLPSGRKLSYCRPKIGLRPMPWDRTDLRPALVFLGVDSTTTRWTGQDTYGGKLCENAVQAAARDILAEAMLRVEAVDPYEIVLHVHDEAVTEVPEGEGSVKELEAIMSELPAWAEGCPIGAEGWRGRRYKK